MAVRHTARPSSQSPAAGPLPEAGSDGQRRRQAAQRCAQQQQLADAGVHGQGSKVVACRERAATEGAGGSWGLWGGAVAGSRLLNSTHACWEGIWPAAGDAGCLCGEGGSAW